MTGTPHWSASLSRFLVAVLAAGLAGCSSQHYVLNQPLRESREASGYAIRNLSHSGNSDSLNIVLALSGGGYRASALALAVMEVLNETNIVWEGQSTTVMQEVDFISGVSGGALPAAFYALRRESFFGQFEREVLGEDLQSRMLKRFMSPAGFWRQASATYGRGDLLQELLDEHVFHGATFADLVRERPMVYLNATDMGHGERFEFSQDQFDYLCSDLNSVPLARAVAASMAVPVVFSPITLWNYTTDCQASVNLYKFKSDIGRSKYVHLVDGGLTDNIGVRMPLEIIVSRGGIIEATKQAGFVGVRKRVFIVVNAQVSPKFDADASPNTPGIWRQLRAAIDVPIDRYSSDSIGLLHGAIERWREQLQDAPGERLGRFIARDTQFYVVEVSLRELPPQFQDLRDIPTSLRITKEHLGRLREFARYSLERNETWTKLLEDIRQEAAQR